MDRRPLTLDRKEDDPVAEKITEFIKRQPWVEDAVVRVRERGRELTAEAHVVPKSEHVSVEEVSSTGELACDVDPRLADVTIAPVKDIARGCRQGARAGERIISARKTSVLDAAYCA